MENQLTPQNPQNSTNIIRQLVELGIIQSLPNISEVHRSHKHEQRIIQREHEIIREEINTTFEIYFFKQ